MTKEEYFQRAWIDYISNDTDRGCANYATEMATETSLAFSAGFNAACQYYREHILELEDNGNKE